MRDKKTRVLAEAAIMVALSTVLSLFTVFKFPWGGGITLMSMLPICLFSIKRGVKDGLCASFVYSLIQLGLGITVSGLFGWGLTPVMLISCIFLDYILAFTVLGFSGIFRKNGTSGVILGIVLCVGARLILHVVSGAVIFASVGLVLNFNIDNSWLYSLVYNAAYMLPEMLMTCVGAVLLTRLNATKKLFMPE